MRTRVIPVLLIQDGGLVKSIGFKNHKYVGDPINAVKIFNDKEVDEIAIIDISATLNNRGPSVSMIQEIASEAFMPLSYGGGLRTLDQIRDVLYHGAEKAILQSGAFDNGNLISEASNRFGAQSVVVCLDYKSNWLSRKNTWTHQASKKTGKSLVEAARWAEDHGAGEIILQSIERDGTFKGYDLESIQEVAQSVRIPVVALGGCSGVENMRQAVDAGAKAVASGSFFVFQMPHRAVLISYPGKAELAKHDLF